MDIDLMETHPTLFKLYTQLAFVFARPDTHSPSSLVEAATQGLERLSQHFPSVADQVANVNTNAPTPPLYKIRPFEKAPRLIVTYYISDEPVQSFAQMIAAGYPMPMLQED